MHLQRVRRSFISSPLSTLLIPFSGLSGWAALLSYSLLHVDEWQLPPFDAQTENLGVSFLSAFLLSHIKSGGRSCWFNLQNISRIRPLLILPIIFWFKSPSYLTELFQQPPSGSPFFCSNILQALLSTVKADWAFLKK